MIAGDLTRLVAADLRRLDTASDLKSANPVDSSAHRNAKTRRGLVARHTLTQHRSDDPLTQIPRVSTCHGCWPPPSQHLESDYTPRRESRFVLKASRSNGGNPVAGLIADASGSLYGTTFDGGASGWGTVFKLTPPVSGKLAWSHTLLYSFTGGADGGRVASPLVADVSGALYGITSQGGDTACQPGAGCGTVFKLSPPDHTAGRWRLTVLHTFGGEPSDGMPYSGVQSGLIMDASGVLYDTTFSGGTSNYGTVFEITQ